MIADSKNSEVKAVWEWHSAIAKDPSSHSWSFQLKDTDAGQKLLALPLEQQKLIVIGIVKELEQGFTKQNRSTFIHYDHVLGKMLSELWRKRLPFTHDELLETIDSLSEYRHLQLLSTGYFVKQVAGYLDSNPITKQLSESILYFARMLETQNKSSESRKQVATLKKLSGAIETRIPLVPGEAWTDKAITELNGLSDEERIKWAQFLALMQQGSGGSPTTKWQKAASQILEELSHNKFRQAVLEWFPLVDKPRTIVDIRTYNWQSDPNNQIISVNADILRSMAWLCALQEDRDVARALTLLALSAYRKVPGIGPRCVRVGNACVWALGNMPGMEGVYQLAILKAKVKFGSAQIGIEKALNAAAEREKMPRDDIEELSTPTYGLGEVGLRCEQFGDFSAELRIISTHDIELHWFRADGKEQKSIPQSVKTDFAEDLKELQQSAKDIQKFLPALRDRIDNLFLARKTWTFETWQERYLNHPLMGVITRRLIWQFEQNSVVTSAIWYDGTLINQSGQPIAELTSQANVTLWHPINASVETVSSWRQLLETKQIQQPFKQAHREIYLLTDAERNTNVYSNRFAAHILKQHQFNGLCALRNWRNKLRLMVDDVYPPATKDLPEWGLRAEFWIEGIGTNYGEDTNESGVYLRIATDQVRFYQLGAAENYVHAGGGGYGGRWGQAAAAAPLPLDTIPTLVLSEIMRDIDLFVGVGSVGNDPTWQDGGPNGRYQDYWTSYAFGELGESAQTRKEVLKRLIPKLKIAKRCEIQEKFLVVQGELRTYKIHLGSSNILMEPNDQYLCIVPDRSSDTKTSDTLFLPFEGDRTLAIILSKAFLLANDKAIKDETITRQIKRS